MRLSRATLAQRSVNLAISSRGLAALYSVDGPIMSKVLDDAIPMKGRLLHTLGGKTESQLYDANGQVRNFLIWLASNLKKKKNINSIDRRVLNERLLEEALAHAGIRAYFRHKLVTADLEGKSLSFHSEDQNQAVTVTFDLCIGADGSYSNVRRQMMRVMR